jgi:hypothetical protein
MRSFRYHYLRSGARSMSQSILRLMLFALIALAPAGCSIPLGPWGGPAYTLEPSQIGTGQDAIVPRNDARYADGEAMDYHSHR